MTLRELEERLTELRDLGATDTDRVWVPHCAGYADLASVEFKVDSRIIVLRKPG